MQTGKLHEVSRIIQRADLSPMTGMVVGDADNYILRYTFDGKQYEEKVRVGNGKMLGGW